MKKQIQSLSPVVTIVNNRPVTTSLAVAEYFGKEHKDILRAIRELEIPNEFFNSNFTLSNYLNEQGKHQPMYEMTRDGFTVLGMGFTGRTAMKFKLDYIEAFNRMEEMLSTGQAVPLLSAGQMIFDKDRLIEMYEDHIALQKSVIEQLKTGTGSRKKVSPEEVRQIMTMASAGYAPSAIAKAVGRKSETVGTVIRRERQRQASLKKEAHQ